MDNKFEIETGKYGKRLVLKSGWNPEFLDVAQKHRVKELELNYAKGWKGADISFLGRLPNLEGFIILDWAIQDVSPIHKLHKLRELNLNTYCKTPLDFSAFPELEYCNLVWRPRAESLFACTTLKVLGLYRYKGHDADAIGRLHNLEQLWISTCPIQSLTGLSSLSKLRELTLAYCRFLESLAGLETLVALEKLDIETCKKITSIEELRPLTHLKFLALDNMGTIDSLWPIAGLANLEELFFIESTNIKDGDIKQASKLPALRRIYFQDRKHYNVKRDELQKKI